jgi:hypothetical protein
MNHECTNHRYNCLNCLLSTSILMLGTHPRERLLLMFQIAVLSKFSSRKDTIITVVPCNLHATEFIQSLFKLLLCTDGFTCTKRDLMFNPNGSWCCIIKESLTMKPILLGFTSVAREQPTRSATHKLIHWYQIFNLILVGWQNSCLLFHC